MNEDAPPSHGVHHPHRAGSWLAGGLSIVLILYLLCPPLFLIPSLFAWHRGWASEEATAVVFDAVLQLPRWIAEKVPRYDALVAYELTNDPTKLIRAFVVQHFSE